MTKMTNGTACRLAAGVFIILMVVVGVNMYLGAFEDGSTGVFLLLALAVVVFVFLLMSVSTYSFHTDTVNQVNTTTTYSCPDCKAELNWSKLPIIFKNYACPHCGYWINADDEHRNLPRGPRKLN